MLFLKKEDKVKADELVRKIESQKKKKKKKKKEPETDTKNGLRT
jgi:hypothetical protein